MFKIHLGDTPNSLNEHDFQNLAQLTESFSGSDISNLVRDAIMGPIRMIKDATRFKQVSVNTKKKNFFFNYIYQLLD